MLKKNDKKFIISVLLVIFAGLIVVVKIDLIGKISGQFLKLLTPLFVGILLALLLNRPIEFLKKQFRKIPYFNNQKAKIPAIIISYLLFLGAVVGLFLIMIPQLVESFGEFISNFEGYSKTFTKTVNTISNWFEQYKIDPKIISNFGEKGLEKIDSIIDYLPEALSKVVSGVASVATVVATFFMGLIISIYILVDKKNLKRQFRRTTNALTPVRAQPRLHHVFTVVHRTLSSYVYTQITESFILGVMCFIGLVIFGFPYPLIISVLNGLSVLIPIVGAWIGGLFGALIIIFVEPKMLLGYFVYIVILQQIENNFIYPRRVTDSLNLPQVWVLVAITVGGGLLGITGALIAVPVASIFYQLIDEGVESKEQKRRLEANEQRQEAYKRTVIPSNINENDDD